MARIAGRHSEAWWYRLGTLILTIVSIVGLFKAARIQPLTGPSASLASWVIFCVCAYGFQQIYEVLFDLIAAIVDGKRRSLERRRGAAGGN